MLTNRFTEEKERRGGESKRERELERGERKREKGGGGREF